MEFWVAFALYLKLLVGVVQYWGGDRDVREVLGVKTPSLLEKERDGNLYEVNYEGGASGMVFLSNLFHK